MQLRTYVPSRLYRDFRALEPGNYHGFVRFYETHEVLIQQLEPEEQYEIRLAFVNALFEVGAYRQFLAVVDLAILASLDGNFTRVQGEQQELFEHLLFRKAAAYLQVLQAANAEHVIRELLRINPGHKMALLLFRKSLRLQDTAIRQYSRAISILFFGLSAFIILAEILFVRPFYNQYTATVEWSRNLIFLSGLILLSLSEAVVHWRAFQLSRRFLKGND